MRALLGRVLRRRLWKKALSLQGKLVRIELTDRSPLVGELVGVSPSRSSLGLRSLDPRIDSTEHIGFRDVTAIAELDLAGQQEASAPLVVERLVQRLRIAGDGSVQLFKHEVLVPRTPGLQSIRDQISCSAKWNPGAVGSSIRPVEFASGDSSMKSRLEAFSERQQTAGQVEYEQQFEEALLPGVRYVRETNVPFPSGTYLADPEDSFSHEVRRVEEEITIEIEFPEGMRPEAVLVTQATAMTAPEYLETLELIGGKATFSLQGPAMGDKYTLKWLNQEDVRLAVQRQSGKEGG